MPEFHQMAKLTMVNIEHFFAIDEFFYNEDVYHQQPTCWIISMLTSWLLTFWHVWHGSWHSYYTGNGVGVIGHWYYLYICCYFHVHFYNLLTWYHQQPIQEPMDTILANQVRLAGQIEACNKLLKDREKKFILWLFSSLVFQFNFAKWKWVPYANRRCPVDAFVGLDYVLRVEIWPLWWFRTKMTPCFPLLWSEYHSAPMFFLHLPSYPQQSSPTTHWIWHHRQYFAKDYQ